MKNSSASAEILCKEANELLINDDFENALKIYTEAISIPSELLFDCFIGRSQTYLKLKKYNEALEDAQKAFEINDKDWRAFHKKGLALFNLKQYDKSLESLEQGLLLADTDSIKKIFNEWIAKCKKENPKKELDTEIVEQNKPTIIPAIKHEWYQSESQVIVSILAKNLTQTDLSIETKENILSIQSNNPEKAKINFNFNLEQHIIPDQTQIKYMASKVEIKLKKSELIQWKKLEIDPKDLSTRLASNSILYEKKPEYPSSSKKHKDWDKLAADITAEEKDEKLEGDAALNKLFRDVYSNGSDETRKAMNKSYVESGGTVLSTNWQDIGAKKLDVKPPDGMEWKKWDS